MYGIGNISSSVSKMLTPAETLGAPGDMYVITDTRLRPRKDLSETKAFERFDIREFNSSEISRLQSEDPLLFEQIKADVNKGLGKPNIKLEFNTNEELADFLKENRKSSAFDNYVDVTATESGTAADRAAATREKIKRAAILPGSGSKTLPGTMLPTPLPTSPTSTAKALPPYRNERPSRKLFTKFKMSYPDHIVLVKDGDFFVTYGNDAATIAPILKTKLLSDSNGDLFTSFIESYLDSELPNLLLSGFKCAVVYGNSNVSVFDNAEQYVNSLPPTAPKEPTSTPSGNTVKFSPKTKQIVEPIEVVNHGLSITGRSGDPSYVNVYWSDKTSFNDWWEWANQRYKKYGGLVTFVDVDEKNNKYKFYFPIEDKMEVLKFLLNPSKYEETNDYIIIRNLADIRRINHGYGSNNYLTILRPHVMKDPKSFSTAVESETPAVPKEPKALPPEPEPTPEPEVTAESVTDEEIDTSNRVPVSVDFNSLQKSLYNASYWSSFDPERAAASDVAAMKSDYTTYAAEVPEGYENAFNAFFNKLSNNIISLKSKTANVAVTGSGGISARKAERLNRNFDAYMQAYRNFDTELERYVNKLKRRAKRREFLSKSLDERSDDRINELKEDIDKIASSMAALKAKDDSVLNLDFYRRHWPEWTEKMVYDTAVGRYRSAIAEAKQTLLKKVENEYYKGHQRTVNAVVDYVRERGIYTPNSKIFGYYKEIQESEPDTANEGTKFQGAEILADEHLDRLQIKFDGKPSEEVRNDLKKSGFRWSPHYGVWQRQLTNDAMWNAKRILNKHFTPASLGKPTIKLEFENNGDLMSIFDTDGVSGMTVNDRPADIFNCPEWQLQCKGFTPTYERLENYDHLVAPSYGEKTLVGYGFDNATLDELVEACRNYRQVEGLAKHLQGDSALQSAFNIWHWLHTNVRYDYDAPGEEEIRTPARCYADRLKGVDCDCLAVMTACLLINMGYRPKFEIVGFGDDGKYSHIFVNLDGAAVDRVLPVFLQRPDHITNTKIMDIPVYRLNGCDVAEIRALSGIYADTLQRIENGDATADDSINFRKTQVLVTLQGSDPWAYRLGAVLMPYVAAVGDDGTYYFTNADIASLATQSDAELREMLANGIADEDINKWLANVIVKLNNAATADAMSFPGTRADATQVVVIINPQRQAVTVEGNMFSAEMVTCNPLTAAMLKNLQMLFAVNFLGIATRFAIGLISAEQAADLGYSFDAYTKAVAAVNKLKGFYSALGGNIDNVIATIQTGSAKMPLTEYDENAMLVEISDTDATINGLANAVAGINGLGGAVTIGTAIASLGDYLNIIIEWVKDVTPATSIVPGVSPDGTPAEDDGNLLWYLMAGFAAVGAVGAAVKGDKKKKKRR